MSAQPERDYDAENAPDGDSSPATAATPSAPAKHTPGPWTVKHEPEHAPHETDDVVVAGPFYVASIHRMIGLTDDDNQTLANARLIAAAPDLLEACKAAFEFVYSGVLPTTPKPHPIQAQLRAAIAKAEKGGA